MKINFIQVTEKKGSVYILLQETKLVDVCIVYTGYTTGKCLHTKGTQLVSWCIVYTGYTAGECIYTLYR